MKNVKRGNLRPDITEEQHALRVHAHSQAIALVATLERMRQLWGSNAPRNQFRFAIHYVGDAVKMIDDLYSTDPADDAAFEGGD